MRVVVFYTIETEKLLIESVVTYNDDSKTGVLVGNMKQAATNKGYKWQDVRADTVKEAFDYFTALKD